MLSEDVVREVDKLAHRMGVTRSGLINSILAEHVGFVTPERRINDILSQIEQFMQPSRDLVPFLAPNAMSLSLKSALEYKYRPTVKYEVTLFQGNEDPIGEISVVFRTQSEALLDSLNAFFRVWKQIEDVYFIPAGKHVDYALYDGRFTRSIASPSRDADAETLAKVLAEYLEIFDSCMKRYITGRAAADDLQRWYSSFLAKNRLFI
jgi:hypothetical protein